MKSCRTIIIVATVLAVAVAFPLTVKTSEQAVPDAVVNFGPPHPQPANPLNHRLVPDEVTINKGGTVTFIMNAGGHRVTIYPVSDHTVRADIEEDLCQGPGAPSASALPPISNISSPMAKVI